MRQLAIIKGVGFGMRDAPVPVLWFEVNTGEGAALQCLRWEQAEPVIRQVHEVHDLEGKPCWVETDGMTMRFIELAKI